jgi:hypothetical protein
MTRNEEARPRSKRTKKEKEIVVDEVLSTDGIPEVLAVEAPATDSKTDERDGSEIVELPVLPLRGTVVFPLTVVH